MDEKDKIIQDLCDRITKLNELNDELLTMLMTQSKYIRCLEELKVKHDH